MKIIKVYTETTTAEKLYSVMLTEDEVALFSKMEDEDYLDEQEKRKESVKHAKGVGTATGALVGAGLGHSLGRGKGKLIGATAGAVGGGVLGRYAGKSIKKRTEDDANKKITRYKNASEHDKKYLREKNEKEKDRRIQERQARAMENTAWHTSRWYSKKEFNETPFERSQRLQTRANQFKTKDELEGNISELKQILEQNKKNYETFGKYSPSYDRSKFQGRNWALQKTIEQKEAYLNNWDKIKQEEKSKRRKDNLKALGYAGAAMVSAPIIGIGLGKLLS